MCQEERLQQQKKNQDEYLRLLREEQQKELKRAESAKDVRAQEQQLVSGIGKDNETESGSCMQFFFFSCYDQKICYQYPICVEHHG